MYYRVDKTAEGYYAAAPMFNKKFIGRQTPFTSLPNHTTRQPQQHDDHRTRVLCSRQPTLFCSHHVVAAARLYGLASLGSIRDRVLCVTSGSNISCLTGKGLVTCRLTAFALPWKDLVAPPLQNSLCCSAHLKPQIFPATVCCDSFPCLYERGSGG